MANTTDIDFETAYRILQERYATVLKDFINEDNEPKKTILQGQVRELEWILDLDNYVHE